MSRTKYAILGMLTNESMTGYDMKRVSDEALGHFWHESFGNLYPRLKKLVDEQLVAVRVEERAMGPDAKVYSLTDAGRSAFIEWLAESPGEEFVRSELLLKLFFGVRAAPGVIERHVLEYRERLVRQRDMFGSIERQLRLEQAGNPNQPFWLMTLLRGQLVVNARLEWCDACLEMLQSGADAVNALEAVGRQDGD